MSIDEKRQIQALDRTHPGLPLKPGQCGTMTHDYKRNGTTTPLAAIRFLRLTRLQAKLLDCICAAAAVPG